METAVAVGRNGLPFLCFLQSLYRPSKWRRKKGDWRSFSWKTLNLETNTRRLSMGGPQEVCESLELMKKSICLCWQTVWDNDEEYRLWSWLSGYKSWLHHLLVLWSWQVNLLFSHLQMWENSIFLLGLLWEVDELVYEKHLEQCLLHSLKNVVIIISSDIQKAQKVKNHLCRPSSHWKWEVLEQLNGTRISLLLPGFPLTMAAGRAPGWGCYQFWEVLSHCLNLEFPLAWISPSFLNEENPSMTPLKHKFLVTWS